MDLNLENVRQVLVNTGNILSLNDITKKPGQNPTEELVEAINLTIKSFQEETKLPHKADQPLVISRSHDGFVNKAGQDHATDPSDLKIGLKIFLTNDNSEFLVEAIEKVLHVLKVEAVQNLIIAFKPTAEQSEGASTAPATDHQVEQIKKVWRVLEQYVTGKKIQQIGLADVEEAAFRQVHEWAQVKPSIIQINLATCCVVPPTLQTFCRDNDIQLLTHSDPADILPTESVEAIFGHSFRVNWALRYLIHIQCRGVLTTKGYLISINK